MADTLSAKQYILSAAEIRYNRKSTSLRRGGAWPLGSAPGFTYMAPKLQQSGTHLPTFFY